MSSLDPQRVREIGGYPVQRFIAEGGQAWVFQVQEPRFEGVWRALKVLKPEAGELSAFERFKGEARALALIEHPNLVNCFDFGRDPETGLFFYTMTYVDGPTLTQRVVDRGPLTLAEVGSVFSGVLSGLAAIHEAGYVHRDVKPSNILLGRAGRVYVTDLGILKEETTRDHTRGLARDATRTGMALGSINWMSPEQAAGKRVTPASDVFSTGLVLFYALQGSTLYDSLPDVDSTSGQSVLMYLGALMHAHAEFDLILPDSVPEPVRDVVRTACRFDPANRYPDAETMEVALLDALGQARHGAPIQVERQIPAAPAPPHVWRRIAVGLALATAVSWFAYQWLFFPWQAKRMREQAMRRQEQVAAIVGPGDFLEPTLAAAMGELAEEAGHDLDQGNEYLEDGLHQEAASRFRQSNEIYLAACTRLLDEALAERAETAVAAARARVASFESEALSEDLRPQVLLPEAWSELQAGLETLVLPASGLDACQRAVGERTRLVNVSEVEVAAGRLSSRLDEKYGELVDLERKAALEVRKSANAEKASFPVFGELKERAEEELGNADSSRKEGVLVAAIPSYRESGRLFGAALDSIRASRVREEYIAREKEAQAEGVPGQELRESGRIFDLAEDLMAKSRYQDAEREYYAALERLRSVLGEYAVLQVAHAARRGADEARERAIEADAREHAKSHFERAEGLREAGQKSLAKRRGDQATQRFEEASAAYAQAHKEAVAVVQATAQKKTPEERKPPRVEIVDAPSGDLVLHSGDTRVLRFRAEDPYGGPGQILLERDGRPMTSQSYTGKGELSYPFQAEQPGRYTLRALAQEEESRKQSRPVELVVVVRERPAPVNQPPTLARSPKSRHVEVRKGASRRFRVEAKDPDGDPLRYEWTVGVKAGGTIAREQLSESGPEITLQPGADTEVQVRVTDGKSTPVTAEWQVAVVAPSPPRPPPPVVKQDRPPVLEILEPSGPQAIDVGESREVRVRIEDLDGDPVEVVLSVQGVPVKSERFEGSGEASYDFQAYQPGEFRVTAQARQKGRVVASTEVVITARPSVTSPPPPVNPEVAAIQRVIERYERAYEAKDVTELKRVWVMTRTEELFVRKDFQDCRTIALDLDPESPNVSGSSATLLFRQTLSCDPQGTAREHLVARLIRRSDGAWYIQKLDRR